MELPHLHWDWAHPAHICTGAGLTPPTSAPGPGSPRPDPRSQATLELLMLLDRHCASLRLIWLHYVSRTLNRSDRTEVRSRHGGRARARACGSACRRAAREAERRCAVLLARCASMEARRRSALCLALRGLAGWVRQVLLSTAQMRVLMKEVQASPDCIGQLAVLCKTAQHRCHSMQRASHSVLRRARAATALRH